MSPFGAGPAPIVLEEISGASSATVSMPAGTVAIAIATPSSATNLEVVGAQSGTVYWNAAPGSAGVVNVVMSPADYEVTVTVSGASSGAITTVSTSTNTIATPGGGSPLVSGPQIRLNSAGAGGPGTGYSITVTAEQTSDVIYVAVVGAYGIGVSISASGMAFAQVTSSSVASAFDLFIYRGTNPIIGGNVISIATSGESSAVGVAIGNLSGNYGGAGSNSYEFSQGAAWTGTLDVASNAVGVVLWTISTNGAPIYMAANPITAPALTLSAPQVNNSGISEGAAIFLQLMLNLSSAAAPFNFGTTQMVSSNGNPIWLGWLFIEEIAAA